MNLVLKSNVNDSDPIVAGANGFGQPRSQHIRTPSRRLVLRVAVQIIDDLYELLLRRCLFNRPKFDAQTALPLLTRSTTTEPCQLRLSRTKSSIPRRQIGSP